MGVLGSIVDAFNSGGTWMWVILALQIVSLVIIMERVAALYFRKKVGSVVFANEFEEVIKKGDLQSARAKAEAVEGPLSRAVLVGVRAAENLGGKDEIQGKMDECLLSEAANVSKRTDFLSMLANVGTLTGLLGTIVGMIKSFAAVSDADPMEKATALSAGIAEAMNTTAYGLIMAIPALVMFAVLNNRTNELTEDLNQGALKVFNWLSYSYESVKPAKS